MAYAERRKVAEHAQRLLTGTAGRACILICRPYGARLLGRAPAAHCWCRCSRGLRRQTAVLNQGSMRHPHCSVPSIPRQFCSACFWLRVPAGVLVTSYSARRRAIETGRRPDTRS